jgi:hypothetical protein
VLVETLDESLGLPEVLIPNYDLLSTLAYVGNDRMALESALARRWIQAESFHIRHFSSLRLKLDSPDADRLEPPHSLRL